MDDVCICIPSYRVKIGVLDHYSPPEGMQIFIVSDPATFDYHSETYTSDNIEVTPGVEGMAPQVAECYRVAAHRGFDWFFRLDDDLGPDSFLHKDGHHPDLPELLTTARECAEKTQTTLVGFSNTLNRFWMGEGYGRTYGLIHGAANLTRSSFTPEKYLDPSISYFEDVYRSLAHREQDGAVGRVGFIGVDKSGSTVRVEQARDLHQADIEKILTRFPGMVTCEGTKEINGGKTLIANWRYKKSKKV